MIYAYLSKPCFCRRDSTTAQLNGVCAHGNPYKRDYSSVQLRATTAFQPHYNYSVGKYVSTEQEFRDQLKYTADDNSMQTGTDHKYEMVDPADMRRSEPETGMEVVEQSIRDREKLGI